jgi:hypothetical protein
VQVWRSWRSWRSRDRGGLEVMQAWSRRGLETWRYGGCGGMEARSGGLEGVGMEGLEGVQAWKQGDPHGSSAPPYFTEWQCVRQCYVLGR